MEIKHINSLLQRKIDQKGYLRTSQMQMHCLISHGYILGTFNTITLHTPLHVTCSKLFPYRGKKYISRLIRFLQKRLGKYKFV